MAKPEKNDLFEKIVNAKINHENEKINYYGEGNAAEKIKNILTECQ